MKAHFPQLRKCNPTRLSGINYFQKFALGTNKKSGLRSFGISELSWHSLCSISVDLKNETFKCPIRSSNQLSLSGVQKKDRKPPPD
jgi:hypothetical protein